MSDKYPGGFVTANAPAGFSVAFDGTGDYLTVASNANLILGTGAFTIEAWFYVSVGNTEGVLSCIDSGSGSFGIGIYFPTTTTFRVAIQSNSVGVANFDSTVTTGKWYHVAAVRDGSNNFSAFLNGTRIGTTTNTTNISLGAWGIARLYANSGSSYNGYISNVRIVKGTAVYDPTQTTINTPTQLFPITNTQLLTCQSPTIIDNSTNNFTITANGDAKVSNFTPFAAYQGFNPALGAAAGGVWTLDEAAYYQNNRQWPIYDPYFKNTTLMLHGNGTNAAQNNTFLDSSTNNFTITRNGNTTQGSFTPFSQTGWSSWFDGTTNTASITTPQNAAFNFGTGDFSVEAWVYATATQSVYPIVQLGYGAQVGGPYTGWAMNMVDLTSIQFYRYDGTETRYTFSVTIPQNTWVHIAVTRSSSSMRAFVNGVQIGAAQTATTSYNNVNSDPLIIGKAQGGAAMSFPGYISNVRVIKGSAVYTNSFTPSTQPLTAVTNTVLLACQNSRFVDNSANNFPFSTTGSASVQAFSPFVPAYITPTTYSNWFNKSTGYLTVPSNTAFNFSTGDFTIEAWIWFNQTADASGGGQCLVSGTTAAYPVIYVSTNGGTTLSFAQNSTLIASGTIQTRAWNHVAVTRSGSSLRFFVGGILAQTATYSTAIDFGGVYIGAQSLAGVIGFLDGAISNLRMLKGTALYTANFTPPTAPLTNITNTSLLTCQSSTFIDNSTANGGSGFTLTAVGGVQPLATAPFNPNVDTTTLNSAYSTSLIGGSAYFDGTGDYLSTATNAAFALGTSDFTFETWVYPTVAGNDSVIFDDRNSSGGTNGFAVSWASSNGIRVIVGAPNVWDIDQTTAAVGRNSWTHYALTRSGTTFRIFLNGALVYTSGAISGSMGTTAIYATVGAAYNGANPFTGNFSGTRLIKGTCLYTSSFALPITPPTPVTNTSLLLNYTNGAIFDNTAKNVLETVGNAQISTTQSKWGGSSISFDGTGDYLVSNSGTDLYAFGSGNFTIECWVYFNTVTGAQVIYDGRPSGSQTTQPTIYMDGAVPTYYASNSVRITGSSLSTGQWYHIAVARSGSSTKMFVNGTQVGSTYTDSIVYTNTTNRPVIGVDGFSPGNYLNGYIDDLRVTKGYARYTANFTPPTSQLQDQ
jgi:hypothetical protein